MTLQRLSHHARAIVCQFVAFWTRPARHPPRLARVLISAMEAERAARERGDTRALHAARQRLRQARHEGLRFEIANRKGTR